MSNITPNCEQLPEGYIKTLDIDLKNNKKQFALIMGLSAAIAVIMFVIGYFICPLPDYIVSVIDAEVGVQIGLVIILIIGTVLYIVLHELTHGICFHLYSGKRSKYGLSLTYAYAYSDYYYNKSSYLVIGLAPVVIFFVIFLLLNIFLPPIWFWAIYLLQLTNVSGAAGDAYVTVLLLKQPSTLLVYDVGTGMSFYNPQSPTDDETVQEANDDEQ